MFIKCPKCKVNIPEHDLLDVDIPRCTLCNAVMNLQHNESIEIEQPPSAFAKAQNTNQTSFKRWVEVKTKTGKTYYHNSETGQDQWTKPSDFGATADPNPFRTSIRILHLIVSIVHIILCSSSEPR